MPLIVRVSIVVLLCFAGVQSSLSVDTLYVRHGATGGDGKSWATAYGDLQQAIDIAQDSGEIWVSRGTYRVGLSGYFNFMNRLRIYGGFKGTETLREHRDWLRFRTILSADVLGNDGTVTDPTAAVRLDNAKSVARFLIPAVGSIDSTTVIDGIEFQGASAIIGGGHGCLVIGSPVFRNCRFSENATPESGAGVFIEGTGRPRFEYCVFARNVALNGAAAYVDVQNDSGKRGPIFAQCVFENNVAGENGGAVFLADTSQMEIQSNVFYHNIALGGGGAIYAEKHSRVLMYNSTLARNEGGPQRGWMFEGYGADIVSCSFWHGAEQIGSLILRVEDATDTARIITAQCLVQNDPTYGFYTIDPEFIDVENPTGADGYWGTDDDGLRVPKTSICFDKGLVTSYTNFTRVDALGNPRVVGNKPEIGAYEIQRDGHEDYVNIMSEIRQGKLVLLYRHGITDWQSKDPGPSPECFPGRNLSEDGRDQTKSVGKYIKALNVPLEDVFTSPVCRCWESALYMAGRYTKTSHWGSGSNGSTNDSLRLNDLTSIPLNGCRMINTHDAIIVPSIDASSAEIEEGDNAVLRPNGETFEWISHFTSDNWERYRVRFPDASVGVDYETPQERHAQAELNTLLYSANSMTVYNVLGTELLSRSGDPQQLRAAIDAMPGGWYAVLVTDIDGSIRTTTFVSNGSR